MAHKIDPDLCASCGTCAGECPQEAISEGTPYTWDNRHVFSDISRTSEGVWSIEEETENVIK